MESAEVASMVPTQETYDFVANQLVHGNKSGPEVAAMLVQQGMSKEDATTIVTNMQAEIKKAKNERANKDMLYGALWCVGGIVGTAANIGFIFWGAIVFGGYQFIRGAISREAEG